MNASILNAASGTFCKVQGEYEGRHFDTSFLLPGGMPHKEALLQRAEEFDQRAAREARYAAVCREAAKLIK